MSIVRTTLNGDTVEITMELAKQLIQAGKKRPEDFEILDDSASMPDQEPMDATGQQPVAPSASFSEAVLPALKDIGGKALSMGKIGAKLNPITGPIVASASNLFPSLEPTQEDIPNAASLAFPFTEQAVQRSLESGGGVYTPKTMGTAFLEGATYGAGPLVSAAVEAKGLISPFLRTWLKPVGEGALNAASLYGQNQISGDPNDPLQYALMGGVPLSAQAVGSGVRAVGGGIQDRGAQNAYTVLRPQEAFRTGPNPVTKDLVEDVFLKQNAIPTKLGTTTEEALNAMEDFRHARLAKFGNERSALEAANPYSFELADVARKGFDEAPEYVTGAISRARQSIIDSTLVPYHQKAKLQAFDDLVEGLVEKFGRTLTADEAVELATSFSRDVDYKTGTKAMSEAAKAIMKELNAGVEAIAPEVRAKTREMAPYMAFQNKGKSLIETRAGEASTQAPRTFGMVASATRPFERNIVNAQRMYNLGDFFTQNSPILSEAVRQSRGPILGQMFGVGNDE